MGAEPSSDEKTSGVKPVIGSTIGPYRIVRMLGSGGMGAVYEALNKQIGRRVAIKVLHSQFAARPEIVSRFLNEARAANLVHHPGIVDIYEFGQTPFGMAYIVMEYIDGVSLSARMRESRAPLGLHALPLFHKMALALAAAHEKGIVHRDLKPDNVMLVPDLELAGGERIKLLDFGIAKLAADAVVDEEADTAEPGEDEAAAQPEFKTRTGALLGTPAYMSPEQCRGAEKVTDRTDVYSFGLMLYRALSGSPAYVGRTDLEYLLLHTSATPDSLRDKYGVDAELAALVHATLAKAPEERPTMAEVAVRLSKLASRLQPGPAGPAGVPKSGVTPLAKSVSEAGASLSDRATTLASAAGTVESPVARRTRALVVVSSVLAGVLVVVLVGLLSKRPPVERSARLKPVAREGVQTSATQPATTATPQPAAIPATANASAPVRVHWEITTTPPGALVVSAESNDVLGVTPWRHDRDSGTGSFQVLLRLPRYQVTPVKLDRGRDAVVMLALLPATTEPVRPKKSGGRDSSGKSSAATNKNLTNEDLPVVE